MSFHKTEGKPVQKFFSKLIGECHVLLTRLRNWKYAFVNSKTHPSLTSCIFLIGLGCVLFVLLGDCGRSEGKDENMHEATLVKADFCLDINIVLRLFCIFVKRNI